VDLTILVREEAGGYWSQIRQLPGCFASARTLDELREALGEAIGLYLWDEPITFPDVPLDVGETDLHLAPPSQPAM
jgi:predicted RNase H-like HicB family nuclease